MPSLARHGTDAGSAAIRDIEQRVATLAWAHITEALDAHGATVTAPLLARAECETLIGLYSKPEAFRSRVVMQRHGFGLGEYQYFVYPLPPTVSALRESLYTRLVPVANRWHTLLGIPRRFPPQHRTFLRQCHRKGQQRPTPLLLRYHEGDYNCLHQDVYGEEVFPLQVTILLSDPEHEFKGGEFVLTEQRPRMQSRAEVVPLHQGQAVIFSVRYRPVRGTRGVYRVNLRHGVSRLRSGVRYTCGIIFHDAV